MGDMSTTEENEAQAAAYEREALRCSARADMEPSVATYWRQRANRYNQMANSARHGGES